jgi:hypothetical protein
VAVDRPAGGGLHQEHRLAAAATVRHQEHRPAATVRLADLPALLPVAAGVLLLPVDLSPACQAPVVLVDLHPALPIPAAGVLPVDLPLAVPAARPVTVLPAVLRPAPPAPEGLLATVLPGPAFPVVATSLPAVLRPAVQVLVVTALRAVLRRVVTVLPAVLCPAVQVLAVAVTALPAGQVAASVVLPATDHLVELLLARPVATVLPAERHPGGAALLPAAVAIQAVSAPLPPRWAAERAGRRWRP